MAHFFVQMYLQYCGQSFDDFGILIALRHAISGVRVVLALFA